MEKKILITKADGETEQFDIQKLINSLEKAQGTKKTVQEVTRNVQGSLRPGMSTNQIYQKAFSTLKRLERPVAARYSMKRAILDLGPSGFPFEDFVAEIFRAKGLSVERGKMMQGSCVEHEVDIVASNEKSFAVGEIKFHNDLGLKSDLKVALYVHSRVEDLRKHRIKHGERPIDEGWLITNTSFTRTAIQYAQCVGLKAISWTYPRYGNLQDLIEETRLHPITCLTTLTRGDKIALMERGVVLCKSIDENRNTLSKAGINGVKLSRALDEGKQLCGI